MIKEANRYLNYIFPIFNTRRTREIFNVNPTVLPTREEAQAVHITAYNFSSAKLDIVEYAELSEALALKETPEISWINIDGIRKKDIELLSSHFTIHPLIVEDILSVNQRPKTDEIEGLMFCLMNMLYLEKNSNCVEAEQVSIVLGNNFVITIQEDPSRDVFNNIREKLKLPNSKLRHSTADYLCYALVDTIVDSYFTVLERMGDKIEELEERIIRSSNTRSLAHINSLKKELIVLRRNIGPVRDVVSGFIRSDSDLLQEKTTKYFKDIYDHILQANDVVENYRDMMMNLNDLYLSQVNLKMNEVMKVMAIVTCLLAPATVIGGIFGMNFDRIPWLHDKNGFYIAVGIMLIIPLWMVWVFRKRGWF